MTQPLRMSGPGHLHPATLSAPERDALRMLGRDLQGRYRAHDEAEDAALQSLSRLVPPLAEVSYYEPDPFKHLGNRWRLTGAGHRILREEVKPLA